jgi:mono/diheme cytochrome c family protein
MLRILTFAILVGSLAFGQKPTLKAAASQIAVDPSFYINLANRQNEKQAADCPHTVIASQLTEDMRRSFYCLHEGSDLLPASWLRVLPGLYAKTFLDPANLSHYGLLPDRYRPRKMIGISEGANGMIGVNCAACHVSQINFEGSLTPLIDGGPSFFDSELFTKDMLGALKDVLTTKGFLQFVENLASQNKLDWGLKSYSATGLIPSGLPDLIRRPIALVSDATKDSLEVYPKIEKALKDAYDLFNNPPPNLRFELHDLKFEDFVTPPKAVKTDTDVLKMAEYLRERIRYFKILEALSMNKENTRFGPGRVDDFGGARGVIWPNARVALNGPVRYLDLWSFQNPKSIWVHWDLNMNSAFDRNLGQAITGGALYGAQDKSVITVDAVAIGELDKIARSFRPPRWPGTTVPALAAKGQTLFNARCKCCHGDNQTARPFDTDRNSATLYTVPMPGPWPFVPVARRDLKTIKNLVLAGLQAKDRATIDPVGDAADWNPRGQYVPRSLRGIWAAAPYLHNGSVLSLRALLDPSLRNPQEEKFRLEDRVYVSQDVGYKYLPCDPNPDSFCFNTTLRDSGNSNQGHVIKPPLLPAEVNAILEYLKTL